MLLRFWSIPKALSLKLHAVATANPALQDVSIKRLPLHRGFNPQMRFVVQNCLDLSLRVCGRD
ncbi:hypothetical protein [Zhongshania borealis]|uniref:Uncharacterized protein n=1 Tax=Zhongshania borealis TaxID=889488 RepID=A0ABP7WML5_9GAMM